VKGHGEFERSADVNWIHIAQLSVRWYIIVNTEMNVWE